MYSLLRIMPLRKVNYLNRSVQLSAERFRGLSELFRRKLISIRQHNQMLKEFAVYVTKNVEEDGMEYAVKTLGLL